MNFQAFQVNEKSTAVFTPSFTDENGAPTTPVTITWTLSDQNGQTINGRVNVSLTPGASILLDGPDLAILSPTDQGLRILTIKATYNSSLGSGLPINQEFGFQVNNLVNVT